MSDILNELFELLDDGARSPATERATERARPQYRRLEALAADDDELDGIWGAAVSVGAADDPVWFARGFRLGVRLMLAALEEMPLG